MTGPAVRARWYRMAKAYPDMRIRLLIPERWIVHGYGKKLVFTCEPEDHGNLDIRTVRLTSKTQSSFYLVRHFAREIKEFAPDVIFPVHENWQLGQAVLWRRRYAPKARLLFFTMNVWPRTTNLAMERRPQRMVFKFINYFLWRLAREGTDGAMCHYPGIEQQIRKDGYKKPILVQTQVGVDEEVFRPDDAARSRVRAKLGLSGFVVGFAGRITEEKGILDIAAAIPGLPPDVRLLVVGDGPVRGRLLEMAMAAGWSERLHITGFVPQSEVHTFMQAMDCFVLGSRTTASWIDTFPLVVAQAMATGLPVVGSNSGAIPFQLGGKGLLFEEGDAGTISRHLAILYRDSNLRERMAGELLERARSEFCIGGMNPKLRDFIISLQST